MIENDHLCDWHPEKDCCLQLMFWQPVLKPSSEIKTFLWRWLSHRLSKHQLQTTVLLRTPVIQKIIFKQGMLLLQACTEGGATGAPTAPTGCRGPLFCWPTLPKKKSILKSKSANIHFLKLPISYLFSYHTALKIYEIQSQTTLFSKEQATPPP